MLVTLGNQSDDDFKSPRFEIANRLSKHYKT